MQTNDSHPGDGGTRAGQADTAKRLAGAPELSPEIAEAQRRQDIEAAFQPDPPSTSADSSSQQQEAAAPVASADKKPEDASPLQEPAPQPAGNAGNAGNPLARFFHGYWRHKAWTLPLTVLVLAAAVVAVPYSRYAVLAPVVKRDITVQVIDDSTRRPVVSAVVWLDGSRAVTGTDGRAALRPRVGRHNLSVSKKYYSDDSQTVEVPVWGTVAVTAVSLKATGRQVPLSVVNRLTGQPVADALLTAAGTEVKTDKDGRAVLVLPADKPSLPVSVSLKGFNSLNANLTVTESDVPQNKFQITPNGQVYFLSKLTGKIDVVKTDLDGADRQTVLAGTGREGDDSTVLLASRDWKYLALLSRRDSDQAKLYLIDTSNDKLSVIDAADANFQMIGWNDHDFAYLLNRNSLDNPQAGDYTLKSFNAATGKLAVLDQSQVDNDKAGTESQIFSNFNLIGSRVVYTVGWYGYATGNLAGKTNSIRSADASSQDKKDLKTLPADKYNMAQGGLYAPNAAYFAVYGLDDYKYSYYEYQAGTVSPASSSDEDLFSRPPITYLASPSGTKTFWSEQRDGKNVLFTGTRNAQDEKQIASLDDYQPYGWYGDDYVLLSKKGSELYIMPSGGGPITKVADYHKPAASLPGYGGGYGGI